MTITLPYPPSANRYWRHARGRTYQSAEARAYLWSAAFRAKAAGIKVLQGDVHLTVRVFRPAKRGDLDNALKILIDSLCGIAYGDDKQITSIHAARFEDKKNPRVEVSITAAPKATP